MYSKGTKPATFMGIYEKPHKGLVFINTADGNI